MIIPKIPVTSFAILVALLPPANAQTAVFDPASLEAECLAERCISATQAAMALVLQQGLERDEINSQIGVIAAALFAAAKRAEPEAYGQITLALMMLAELTSDSAQRESLLLLARQIEAGDIRLFDLDAPFAASPA